MSGRTAGATLLALALAAGVAGPARAADESLALRLQAERLISEARCEEALPILAKVRSLAPEDARAARLEGQCRLRLQRYAEAAESLDAALRLDPAQDEAWLQLAIARYHARDLDGARAALDEAERRLPGRAEVSFYRGVLLMEQAEPKPAAAALERAAGLDSSSVDPLASYYAGLAWESTGERRRAEAALQRAIDTAPGSDWAREAQRALDRLHESERKRWWVRGWGGVEYDDNVVLRGSGVSLPEDISGDHDWRGVWGMEAGLELLRTDRWSAGVIGAYAGAEEAKLDDFDYQYGTISAWLDRKLDDDTFVRIQPDASYTWFGGDPFLSSQGVTLSLHRDWGAGGSGRLFARWAYLNYLFGLQSVPFGSSAQELNRDGNEYIAGYDHILPLGADTSLRGGLRYHRFITRGTEYTYNAYEGWLGARRELPFDFAVDVEGHYFYTPYRNASHYPPPGTLVPISSRRRDNIWTVRVALERPITDHVTASAEWRWEDNDSNVAVFDYRREVVGAYLTIEFGS